MAGLVEGLLTGAASIANTVYQNKFNKAEAEKQRQWNEAQAAKQNEWNLQQWNRQNEYNAPTAQMERLMAAGLNPLYFGLDGNTSGTSPTAAQPLGYDRASASPMENPISSGVTTGLSVKSLQKDIELKNAQIDKLSQDTQGVKLDNEWKDKTLEARTESERLSKENLKENIENVKKQREQMEANIKKLIAETENEIEKKSLIQAQTALQKASEKEILEMLPYKKLLAEAQTEAQKAAAAASYMNAAYQKGLIDNGYIDAMCSEMAARAQGTEAVAMINGFKQAVKNGTYWTIDSDDGILSRGCKTVLNGFTSAVSVFGECLAGGLQGILK